MAETAAHPQPSYHIADIFRETRSELDDQSLNLDQRRLVGSIVVCRTPALGGHLYKCATRVPTCSSGAGSRSMAGQRVRPRMGLVP